MASFVRKLAPQLVTPDRQLSYFLPDILSFARTYFISANSPLIVSPHHPPPTYLFQLAARRCAFDLPTYSNRRLGDNGPPIWQVCGTQVGATARRGA